MANDRSQARREAATLLGVDIDHMSPADGLRIDMVSALRLVIDAEQASVLSGGSADLGKLNVAVSSLIALLPGRELPAPESQREDPRQVLWRIYSEMRERGEVPPEGWHQHRIDAQAAEIAALKAQLVGAGLAPALPVVPNSTAITPPLSDIVPPSERAECDPGVKPGPDDWRAQRSTTVIEGKAVKPAPAAPAPRATPTAKPAWEDWLDAGGYGGPGYDRWADNR